MSKWSIFTEQTNIIGYSLKKSNIGKKNAGGVHYEKAMNKEVASKLVQTGSFLELMFWFPKETKIVTFAPLMQEVQLTRDKDRMVIGAIEIVRDVSGDYQQVFKLQGLVVASCATIMGMLFLILRFVVKHGENIIERRAEERLKLEEKLRQAEHLSAIGEMTAGVSHEIRNPLGIIKSSAQLMKKKMANWTCPAIYRILLWRSPAVLIALLKIFLILPDLRLQT